GPTTKEKAALVSQRRYLVVQRYEGLDDQERGDLEVRVGYRPQLRALWKFSQGVAKAGGTDQALKVARWRWARRRNDPAYPGGADGGGEGEAAGFPGRRGGPGEEDDPPRRGAEPPVAVRREGAVQGAGPPEQRALGAAARQPPHPKAQRAAAAPGTRAGRLNR